MHPEISWRGRAALALLLANTTLLFFPPIPPYVKGSLWSYLLKTAVVVLLALETYRGAGGLAAFWSRIRAPLRWGGAAVLATAVFVGGLAIRDAAPGLFGRSIAEVGPWETLSTAVYAGGAVLLWRVAASEAATDAARHLRLVAAGYVLLFLEETDYGGVFGGIIGRVDGTYVGSLHDLLNLAVDGRLHPLATTVLALAVAVTVFVLALRGYLRPGLLRRSLLSADGLGLAAGLTLLVAAGLGEAGVLGALFADPSSEEVVEAAGSVLLAVYALQLSGWGVAEEAPHPTPNDVRGPPDASPDRPDAVAT